MITVSGRTASLLALSIGLAACGGGGGSSVDTPVPVNVDYSSLRLAESHDSVLVPTQNSEQVLRPLRNGLRLSMKSVSGLALAETALPFDGSADYSRTTVQVDGVDESDLVKYDGRYIFAVRPETAPAFPGRSLVRNVLEIARTNAATAGVEEISEFTIEGERSTLPQIYQMQTNLGADDVSAQYLAAVSQNYQAWLTGDAAPLSLVAQPDRTTIQLLDVRDPRSVSQAWKLELDGWMKASRKIGDTLYLVISYRPRVSGLFVPADSVEKREANERLIRGTAANELLPHYRINGGSALELATTGDCVIAADLDANDAFSDLTVIASINLRDRSVKDVSCLSTNVNSVYMSHNTVYVAGEGLRNASGYANFTVLHKFGLDAGNITYRASGIVAGSIAWGLESDFMDEYQGNLRILTTQNTPNGQETHHLNVLQESQAHKLLQLSTLPNAAHPDPIGKPGERVQAVRFIGDRAYVVTARFTDPLYVIDLEHPADPIIAGALEIPGFATYLRPVGPEGSELLLSIGHLTTDAGLRQGVKVELFDVKDIAHPQSIGAALFGGAGSRSEVIDDPHALTLLPIATDPSRFRLALPIDVFDTPNPTDANRFLWSYSGVHTLEISGIGGQSPQLDFHGVIKTAERSNSASNPPYVVPNRSVLHADSVFAIHGRDITSSLWGNISP